MISVPPFAKDFLQCAGCSLGFSLYPCLCCQSLLPPPNSTLFAASAFSRPQLGARFLLLLRYHDLLHHHQLLRTLS